MGYSRRIRLLFNNAPAGDLEGRIDTFRLYGFGPLVHSLALRIISVYGDVCERTL